MPPLVSFCIPASRRADHLQEALSSILEQGCDDIEIIVSDDSGGRLRDAVEAVGDPRIGYHANPQPLGFSGNHTAVLARATGAFVQILHDDDRLLPGYLDAVLAPFEGDERLGYVFTDALRDLGGGRMELYGAPGVEPGRHAQFLAPMLRANFMLPSKTLMRKEAVEQGRKKWPDLIVADMTMYIDGALQGWAFQYIPEPLVVYRQHADQIGVDQERHRGGIVALWDSYRFEDPDLEALREHRVAWGLVGRAGILLQQGRVREARADLVRARRLAPAESRPRRIALRALTLAPPLAGAAERVYRRISRRRHPGQAA